MQYNVFGSKHRSNVQGNEENSVNIATVKRLLLNSETNTETSIFKKNPDLSTLILKTMESETHIFFFWPKIFCSHIQFNWN
jgi:hypothetical protein